MTYPIPVEAFDDRLAVTGTSGSGKTYFVLGALARLLKRGSRAIIIDPLGVTYGLRLLPDGVTPSPYKPVIFGGPHGDLPLSVGAAALIGETCATMSESVILDLSELGVKAQERRFVLAFLTALYRHADREPVHLVIDEADMFAPQKLDDKEGEAAKLLGMMETVVRRGRVKGFIPWLVTQRPAVLNKNVLSQADGVVALKLTASQDRDAIGGWIEGQADRAKGKEILALLPTMGLGEGVVWIPGRSVLKTSRFPENQTFDSSRTPKRGETRKKVDLKPLDLGKLKDRLATVEAEAKANDPAALKAQVADLRAQLAKAGKTQPVAAPKDEAAATRKEERAFAQGEDEGYGNGWEDGFHAGHAAAAKAVEAIFRKAAVAAVQGVELALSLPTPPPTPKTKRAAPVGKSPGVSPKPLAPRAEPFSATGPIPHFVGHAGAGLPPGETTVLTYAVQFGQVTRSQITILAGYTKSTRNAYIARLVTKGFLEVSGDSVLPTDAGRAALPPDVQPLPTGSALQDFWLGKLPPGEQAILTHLIAAYPNRVSREDLSASTGYLKSTRNAYLARMKAKLLFDETGAGIAAARDLFDGAES